MPFMLFGKLIAGPDDTEEEKLKCWNDYLKNKKGKGVVTYACVAVGPPPPLLAQPINVAPPPPPPPPPLLFPIEKNLENSDVGHLSRLLLKKKMIEDHVVKPFFSAEQKSEVVSKEGLVVVVRDVDTMTDHLLVLKMLINSSKSYELVNKWRQKFVRRRDLCRGDKIGMFWDNERQRFCFSVLQRANR